LPCNLERAAIIVPVLCNHERGESLHMPEMTAPSTSAPTTPDVEPVAEAAPATEPAVELVEADLLVEDVSIDGMCGVY
jgi:mycofactocin precursor